MPRLFIAIDVPESHISILQGPKQEIPGFRWTPQSQLHLTLQFLGDTPRKLLNPLESELANVAGVQFSIRPDRLDVFPSLRKARVLVVRMQPCNALSDLQAAVAAAVRSAGVNINRGDFKAHVTIARLRDVSPSVLRRYLNDTKPGSDAFEVNRFHLYESHLSSRGADHVRLASFPLASQGASRMD